MRAGLKCTGVACLRDRWQVAPKFCCGIAPEDGRDLAWRRVYFSALEHTKRVLGYHDPLTHFSDDDGKVAAA